MMPVLRINDSTFAGLSTLKTWYGTRTPGETIDRLVRDAMDQLGMERDEEPDAIGEPGNDGATDFESAPDLTFTKPLAASVNGKALHRPRWATLLHAMIGQLGPKGLDGEKLVRELGVPAKTGRYEEEGFKHYADLGISVQGQSAADVWKEVDRLAKKWRIPVMVEFRWRQNARALYPGKAGVLRSGG